MKVMVSIYLFYSTASLLPKKRVQKLAHDEYVLMLLLHIQSRMGVLYILANALGPNTHSCNRATYQRFYFFFHLFFFLSL